MKHTHPLVLVSLMMSHQVLAQSTCTSATSVGIGTHTVLEIDGVQVPMPVCVDNGPATNGMWYSFLSTQAQSLTVSTSLPANNGLDTRFHIYTGSCGSLACVGGDDDSGTGYLSVATISAGANTTYYIAFDNYWSSAGFDFQISVGPAPPPSTLTFTVQNLTANAPFGVVDMNGDHLDDLVIPGSSAVTFHHQQVGGGFTATTVPTPPATHTASWSMCAGDLDGNGWNDLMYGGGGGVSIMMRNDQGTGFTQVESPFYIFSQRTNMVDLNNDGHLDAFVCHDVDANVYILNDGQGGLAFIQDAMGNTCGNYGSLFTDVDNDGDMDCFIAKCGCDPVDLMMLNNGDLSWTNIAADNTMADSHQSWSSAWGDFDNDGDMDVLIGSSSSNYHKLMRNDGDGTFTNVTAGSGYDAFPGTSIEWTTHDFDNDGYLDIMGGGLIMMGNGDLTFTLRPGQVNNGPIGDLNNDGFLDYMSGSNGYFNNGNDNHWLKVVTVGTVSNANGIGARVEVTTALGTQIREVRSGDGFRYMSSLTTHFGLGADTEVQQLTIHWPSGMVQTMSELPADTMLVVVEGVNNAVTTMTMAPDLEIYPNPTRHWLHWRTDADVVGLPFQIIDLLGQVVQQGTLTQMPIDVSGIAAGSYLLHVQDGEMALQRRFVRQ